MPSLHAIARNTRQPRAFAPWRVLTGLLSAVGVLLIGLGAHSPESHEHVHPDAAHPEHVCAITLAAAGYCDTAAPAPEVDPTSPAPALFLETPESFAWTAPEYWLIPAQAPPTDVL